MMGGIRLRKVQINSTKALAGFYRANSLKR
jgi:hypothetical protein